MTKDEFIIEAILSLNKGNSGYAEDRVHIASQQLISLRDRGFKFDEDKPEPEFRWGV